MDRFFIFTIIVFSFTAFVILGTLMKLINPSFQKKKRNIKWKKLSKDNYIMKELISGKIKCHILLNNSSPYDSKKWLYELKSFMKKPINEQLLSLEGRDIDE